MCGDVTFTVHGVQLDRASVCHCNMCQRWSGGPWIAVSVERIVFERDEALAWVKSSKIAERAFCNRCGSSLFWRMTLEGPYQGVSTVALGALDDRTGVTISKEWFIDRKPEAYAIVGERRCITEAEAIAMVEGGH